MSGMPQRDDRAFASPTEWLLSFVLPGIALGIAFRELIESLSERLAAGHGVLVIAVLSAVALVPLLFWFTTGVGHRLAALAFSVVVGGLLASGIAWSAQRFGIDGRTDLPVGMALGLALPAAFVIAPFFGTVRATVGEAPYAGLFRRAWAQAVVGALALVFYGAVLLLNNLVIVLFTLIEIDLAGWLHDKRWLAGLAGGAFAGAIGIAREREAIVQTLRGLVLALVRSLLPVHLLIVVAFLTAAALRGPASLGTGLSVTAVLLAVAALALTFIAAALGDGVDAIAPRWRRGATRALSVLVLPVSMLAGWRLWLRVDEYGLTPMRVLACALVLLALGYGIGYAVAALRPALESALARTNTAMALLAVSLAVLMLTPWVDPVAVSVRNQLARAEQGGPALERLDLGWLAFKAGLPGRAAVERVRALPAAEEPAFATRLAALDESDGTDTFDTLTMDLDGSPERRRLEAALQSGALQVHVRARGRIRRIDSVTGTGSTAEAVDAVRNPGEGAYALLGPDGMAALLLMIDGRAGFSSACGKRQQSCTIIVSDEPSLVDGGLTAMAVSRLAGTASNARGSGTVLARLLWYTAADADGWRLFDDKVPQFLVLDAVQLDDWFAALAGGELPLRSLDVQGLQIGDALLVPDGQSPSTD